MSYFHAHSHDHTHATSSADAGLMRRATYASLTMATTLLLAKLYAWWETDSLAMLSSFTDSVFDVVMSLANMLAVRYALKPADDDHRFGHSSIEDIAGLAQCACIFASMALIVLQSFERLANPHITLSNPELGIGVSLVGMVFTIALVTFQGHVAKKTGSLVVAADRMHYVSDILFNLGVMVAFGLSAYAGIAAADPAIAILIACVVLWSIRPVAIRAFNNLMDREMPDEQKERILALVMSVPEVRGHHHLRTRYSGAKPFIQLYIDLDGGLNFREAHTITDKVEDVLREAFPGADVIIHPEPA